MTARHRARDLRRRAIPHLEMRNGQPVTVCGRYVFNVEGRTITTSIGLDGDPIDAMRHAWSVATAGAELARRVRTTPYTYIDQIEAVIHRSNPLIIGRAWGELSIEPTPHRLLRRPPWSPFDDDGNLSAEVRNEFHVLGAMDANGLDKGTDKRLDK